MVESQQGDGKRESYVVFHLMQLSGRMTSFFTAKNSFKNLYLTFSANEEAGKVSN